jgi:hypothetical protein
MEGKRRAVRRCWAGGRGPGGGSAAARAAARPAVRGRHAAAARCGRGEAVAACPSPPLRPHPRPPAARAAWLRLRRAGAGSAAIARQRGARGQRGGRARQGGRCCGCRLSSCADSDERRPCGARPGRRTRPAALAAPATHRDPRPHTDPPGCPGPSRAAACIAPHRLSARRRPRPARIRTLLTPRMSWTSSCVRGSWSARVAPAWSISDGSCRNLVPCTRWSTGLSKGAGRDSHHAQAAFDLTAAPAVESPTRVSARAVELYMQMRRAKSARHLLGAVDNLLRPRGPYGGRADRAAPRHSCARRRRVQLQY